MKVIEAISYGQGGCLDIYLPDSPDFDVFLYFHGGGLEAGSRASASRFADMLCEQGIAVVSADYRMYPDAHYPDFIEDAAEAVVWVKEHIAEYGTMKRLIVGGSSAGGYLSMMLCFDPHYLRARGMDPIEIDAWIHDAGQPTAHFNVLREHGIDSRRVMVDERAPLYFIGSEQSYSPMLFVVSDNDMKNRYEQTMLTLSTLKHFGHDSQTQLRVMNGKHCHYLKTMDENGKNLFGKLVLDYIQSV